LKKGSRHRTLLIISLLCIGAIPVQLTQGASLGNIHGTIVDEAGNPLEDVTVSAYLSTGSLEDSKKTNEDGYFRMNLGGTYTLVFEKEGYVIFQKNIQVTQAPTENPDQDIVKLGELEMEKTISLSASVIKRITTPGNKLTLSFTVSNQGEEQENIEFSIECPSDWSTKVLDNTGEIESILLNPGTASYSIEITIHETALTGEKIVLMATGSSTDILEFTIIPKTDPYEIELKSTYLSISEELGQTISLPLTVTNLGEVDRKITLQADIPERWSISFTTNTKMVVKTLLLEPGDSEQLNIELETAGDADVGDYYVNISALDVNSAILDVLGLEVNLREGTSDIDVISSFSEVSVEAGESITFPLAVWNKGEADALTIFTVPTLPENWDVSFRADELEIASIRIPSGESESVSMIVEPPNSVVSGIYDLKAIIESDDGTEYEFDFIIEVVGSYDLELELSTLYTTVQIGGSVTYTAKVTNRGQTAITTLYLDAILPDDWTTSISPVQVTSLDPRDSVTFTIDVDVTSDTESGDYLITMQGLSDQLDSDEIDIRITAQASNTWGYIGLGLAVVAVAGAVYLFRRFKRR
jgi:uncharacterized repeat protein (TIGR01451 family)